MDSLRHVLTVACAPDAAFRLFTTGLGTWWDPAYSPDPARFVGADVVPEVGGVVALLTTDGRVPIGEVLVWEPGAHYAQTWTLGMQTEVPSRLDVRFEHVDGVCTVRLDHGGWTARNLADRARYRDWPHLLGRFANAAARLT